MGSWNISRKHFNYFYVLFSYFYGSNLILNFLNFLYKKYCRPAHISGGMIAMHWDFFALVCEATIVM
jgi:hypothetical protein